MDRVQLQSLLETLLGDEEDEKLTVYFQPPPNITLTYPCVIYKRDHAVSQFADNRPYRFKKRYQVMVIDPDPDSPIVDAVAELPLCAYDRFYTADNLNHDVFNLFF